MNDSNLISNTTGKWRILCLGLNPALQNIQILDSLDLGHVNRSKDQIIATGGKGQNFATATKQFYGSFNNPNP
ncbi:hypothetical protein AYI70_g1098 [Smittium culicis]|uniref:Ribokinase n=1 Tax=Smittium culicis TaxID=133412 RepID=A0A1R1YDZ5_9FUNG|nr:hypothetical protein AYI70_g1098 [Smittium culicis]